jgi:hypothetical protein
MRNKKVYEKGCESMGFGDYDRQKRLNLGIIISKNDKKGIGSCLKREDRLQKSNRCLRAKAGRQNNFNECDSICPGI